MQKLGARMYALSIAPNPDHPHMVAAREEAGMPEEAGLPPEYKDLKGDFSKTRSQEVPEHGLQDLTSDLIEDREPP
jgi:hypothetical protein